MFFSQYKTSKDKGNNVDTIIINDSDEHKNNIPLYIIKFMECNGKYNINVVNVTNNGHILN